MRKYTVITPENIEVEYTLADLGSRSAAAVIDITIQTCFLMIIIMGVGILATFAPLFWEEHYGWVVGIGCLLWFIFSVGYYIGCETAMNGRTIGKRMLKLRVIRVNGQPITLKHAAIRNLLKLFIDMQGIGVVMIFFSKHCRRLGDLAASTLVVSEARGAAPVSLSSLTANTDRISAYLSQEEQAILRAWLERRDRMERPEELRNAILTRLQERFAQLGLLGEFQDFIRKI